MSYVNAVASTSTNNLVPVQAQYDANGNCVGLVGPGGAFIASPININTTLSINSNLLISSTLPTISSGFGTGPTILANSTFAFKVTIGSTTAANGTITFPAAPNGWIVYAADITNGSSLFLQQTGSTKTTATVTSFGITTGTASPMSAGDVILINAIPY